jgi:hypothetical protein
MTAIPQDHFSGGKNLTDKASGGKPGEDLASLLRASLGATPQWTTGVTVTTHVATLSVAGWVTAVEGTTGTSTGPKQQIQSGSPAAGQVDVAYDSAGIATLTFNATDAITVAAVQVVPVPHSAP